MSLQMCGIVAKGLQIWLNQIIGKQNVATRDFRLSAAEVDAFTVSPCALGHVPSRCQHHSLVGLIPIFASRDLIYPDPD